MKRSTTPGIRARLGKGSVIWSALGSERFHRGFQIKMLDAKVIFKKTPELDPAGRLIANAIVLANVHLRFEDGAQVRFSNYPLVVKAGSPVMREQGLRHDERIAA